MQSFQDNLLGHSVTQPEKQLCSLRGIWVEISLLVLKLSSNSTLTVHLHSFYIILTCQSIKQYLSVHWSWNNLLFSSFHFLIFNFIHRCLHYWTISQITTTILNDYFDIALWIFSAKVSFNSAWQVFNNKSKKGEKNEITAHERNKGHLWANRHASKTQLYVNCDNNHIHWHAQKRCNFNSIISRTTCMCQFT